MVFADHFRIIDKPVGNVQQTDDAVHRRTDIVAHPREEIALDLIGEPQLFVLDPHFTYIIDAAAQQHQCSGERRENHNRLDRIGLDEQSDRHPVNMNAPLIQVACFLGVRETVNIRIKQLEELQVAFLRQRHTDVLSFSGQQRHTKGAVLIMRVIFQDGPVSDRRIGLPCLHRLQAFLRVVVQLHLPVSGGVHHRFNAAHNGRRIHLRIGLTVCQKEIGFHDRLAGDKADGRAVFGCKRHADQHIVIGL